MNDNLLKNAVNEETLRKLDRVLKRSELVSFDDLQEVTITLLTTVKELKDSFEKVISDTKSGFENQNSETKTSIKEISYALSDLELKIKDLINNSERASLSQIKELSQRISAETNRMEAMMPSMPDLSIYDEKLAELERKIPVIKEAVTDTPVQLRDKLETLKDDERLDISAIKGFGKRLSKMTDDILNRAIGILDQRTSYLINKVSNLQRQVDTTVSSAFQQPSGTVDGSNKDFVWGSVPNVIVVDGVPMQRVASDTTVNWTLSGTTTSMTTAPNFDIYSPS